MSTDAVKVPLAAKHQGMLVNARWLLTGRQSGCNGLRKGMADHLDIMARRYYSGDIAAVDEFLRLYCLGEAERKLAAERNGGQTP